MRKVGLALAIAVATTFSVGPSQVAIAANSKEARREFLTLWSQRLETYRARRDHLSERHRAAAAALTNPPFAFAKDDNRFSAFTSATLSDGEINGRGIVLTDFLTHMRTKPSIGLTQAWLQDQVDVLNATQADAEKLNGAARALVADPKAGLTDFLLAVEKWAMKKGEAIGRAKELNLIDQNFQSYVGEVARADERAREARRSFADRLARAAEIIDSGPGNLPLTTDCRAVAAFLHCETR